MNNQLTEPRIVVDRLYGGVASGDLASARSALVEDVTLHVPGTHPLAGEHRGPDAVLDFVLSSRGLTDDGEDVEVLDVLEGQRHVAVACRVRATRPDKELDNRTVHLLRMEGGRIAEIWLHNFDDLAVDDFWS